MTHRGHERRTRPGAAGPVHDLTPRSPGPSARRPLSDDPLTARWQEAAAKIPTTQIVARTAASPAMVYRCRCGRTPNLPFLARFASEFGFSLDWLLTGRGPRLLADTTRWALQTAGPRDLCLALGELAEQGDAAALRALGEALEPGRPAPQVVVRKAAARRADPVSGPGPT